MKLLVVGASSFTGSAFCALAKERGHSVWSLSRAQGWDLNGLLPCEAQRLVEEEGCSVVVNFAALNMVAESWAHAPDYYRTNVAGVARLIERVAAAGVKRFVQVSTPEVYGNAGARIAETGKHSPSTPYALSRSALDQHLALLRKERGFPFIITRTVNVYGPGQPLYRIVPKATLAALLGRPLPLHGGGLSERSFIHVRDVAAGILACAERGEDGQTYHMATRRLTTIRELVAKICSLCGADFASVTHYAPERPGKDHAYILNDRKIRRQLGWSDTIPLEEGLTEVVDSVRANLDELKRLDAEYKHIA